MHHAKAKDFHKFVCEYYMLKQRDEKVGLLVSVCGPLNLKSVSMAKAVKQTGLLLLSLYLRVFGGQLS